MVVSLAGVAPALCQQSPVTAILAVEAQDRAGRTVARIDMADVSAASGDLDVEVVALGEARPWEVVIYVDQQLTGSRSILLLLEALADQASELTALGEVQLVLADEQPTSTLRTADASLLEQVLLDLSLQSAGDHALRHGRIRFLRQIDEPEARIDDLARLALAEELVLLRRRQDPLTHWIASYGRSDRPRLLLLLNDSLGLDPRDFYLEHFDSAPVAPLEIDDQPRPAEMARTLASFGWTLVPVVVPPPPEEDDERLSLRTNQSVGFRLRLGGDKPATEQEEPEPRGLDLVEGREGRLEDLVAETGGFVAANLEELPQAIERLAGRHILQLKLNAPTRRATPSGAQQHQT